MVLDSEPVPVTDDIPIQIPDEETEFQPSLSEPQTAEPTPPVATEGHLQKPPAAASPSPSSTVTPGALPDGSEASPTAPVSKAPVNPVQKFSSQDATPPATKPAGTARSDDGALALALLEGRRPPRTASKPRSAQGSFVLQVASYSGQVEAQARRDQLHEAGVTNAFVEPTSIGGKQQYRLRVGPFPSREAAQAAQARLRMLGYDNGFIASQ
jgi:DedD protein